MSADFCDFYVKKANNTFRIVLKMSHPFQFRAGSNRYIMCSPKMRYNTLVDFCWPSVFVSVYFPSLTFERQSCCRWCTLPLPRDGNVTGKTCVIYVARWCYQDISGINSTLSHRTPTYYARARWKPPSSARARAHRLAQWRWPFLPR